jgi:hypothetical protein
MERNELLRAPAALLTGDKARGTGMYFTGGVVGQYKAEKRKTPVSVVNLAEIKFQKIFRVILSRNMNQDIINLT